MSNISVISVAALNNSTFALPVPGGTQVEAMVVNPNTNTIYVLDRLGNIYVISGNTNMLVTIITLPVGDTTGMAIDDVTIHYI